MREYIKKNAQKAIAREEGNTNHLETNQNTTFKNQPKHNIQKQLDSPGGKDQC